MASVRLQHPWQWHSSLAEKPIAFVRPKASPFRLSFSLNPSSAEPSKPTPRNPPAAAAPGPADPPKLAFEKAKAYKKLQQDGKSSEFGQSPVEGGSDGGLIVGNDENNKRVPLPDSVEAAREKAREYRKTEGVGGGGGGEKSVSESEIKAGAKGGNGFESGFVDKGASKKEKLSISSINFVGLGFADKKKGKGLPAGLVPVTDLFPAGDLPDVEIIVGDTSKFCDSTASIPKPSQEDNADLYKPKVSTRGVYPRPGNISKMAMEMIKVTGSNFSPRSTGYQNFFEAFVEDKTNYPLSEENEGHMFCRSGKPRSLSLFCMSNARSHII